VMISPVKIVRLANYVAPASGGLRTALRELGAGYLAAGHQAVTHRAAAHRAAAHRAAAHRPATHQPAAHRAVADRDAGPYPAVLRGR